MNLGPNDWRLLTSIILIVALPVIPKELVLTVGYLFFIFMGICYLLSWLNDENTKS